MSDGFRAVFPNPPVEYNQSEQQNNREQIQRAFDYKLDRNMFDLYVEELEARLVALEARIAALEPVAP